MGSNERLEKFTAKQREKFLPLCPNFVFELRSASDSLKDFLAKNGGIYRKRRTTGWLIDPKNKKVHIYRADDEIEILENPVKISGEDILRGFELDLNEIW